MDKKLDLPRIAKVINDQKPDLVGLQEVDRGVERTQHIDEIADLAKLTKMDYAFAFNLPYQGGQYGVAILSRFRILATDHRHYKNLREAERRGFIRSEVLAHLSRPAGVRKDRRPVHLRVPERDREDAWCWCSHSQPSPDRNQVVLPLRCL